MRDKNREEIILYSYMIHDGDLVMILRNKDGFWWWSVTVSQWNDYFEQEYFIISDEMVCEFIADEKNTTVGVSCASFESVCLAYVDYFQS